MHEFVEIESANVNIRRPRIITECVDHFFHRFNLLHDCVRGAIQDLRLILGHGIKILAAQAFGRQLDWRQRILDFVSEPACNFTPGRISLRLQQRRNVVKHDDIPGWRVLVRWQGSTRAGQNTSSDLTAQNDLLAPLRLAGLEVHACDVHELFEQWFILCDIG